MASTLDAIRFADCVIVMMDAAQPFEKQDLAIADLIAREGRAIVFAVNKWDLEENKQGAISELREKLDRLLPQVAGAELVAISARTGQGIDRLLAAVMAADTRLEHPRCPPRRSTVSWKAALLASRPARDQRTAGAHPLHDPAQDPAAHLRPVRQPAGSPCPRIISAI